jgi:molybdopterin-guanine dinucleotide biosynthesis protein A
MREVAAAIIAGGPARRLGGVTKSLIEIGGRAIADLQLELLRPLFARVFAVANEPAPWRARGVEVVADRIGGAGPLGGLEAALAAAGGAESVVCVAGDLPFLAPALLTALRDRAPAADALAARPGGRAEPLCARYATRLQPDVGRRLAAGRLAVHALLNEVATVWLDDDQLAVLDPGRTSFSNLNTPEDVARAEAAVRRAP